MITIVIVARATYFNGYELTIVLHLAGRTKYSYLFMINNVRVYAQSADILADGKIKTNCEVTGTLHAVNYF